MKIIEGKEMVPPRIIYYAVPGFGKTTFASCFPNPLLIRTEDGARNIVAKKTEKIETFLDFKDVISWLIDEEHDFKTIVIDSLDELESLINADVCAQEGKSDLGEIGFGRGEKKSAAYLGEVLDKLEYLNLQKNIIIVLTAHSIVSEVKDPVSEPYSRFRINVNEKYSLPTLQRWADCIFFGNYKIHTKEVKSGAKKLIRPVGDFSDRVLYTQERPVYLAKNRYNLPAEIELSSNLAEVPKDVEMVLGLIKEDMKK